jgi:uncharacterized membrane protein
LASVVLFAINRLYKGVSEARRMTSNTGFRVAMVLAAAIVLLYLTMPAATADTTSNNSSERSIYVEGYITGTNDGREEGSYPVPGAIIYFIKDQQIVNQTKANAIGYYSVTITSGTYSVVTVAAGFQTLMDEQTFKGTRTLDRLLKKVPYAGLIPYAVNPVIETSPGRPVSVTVCVENSQLQDQYVAFGLQAPEAETRNWVAWCPEGQQVGVRSGDQREISFMFQYNGERRGAYLWYVLVTGGSFYAKIPVVVIVKDMPYESVDLYTNYPERTVKAGDTARFVFNVNNKYARDKPLKLDIQKPDGWGATTGNGTLFYAAENQLVSSDFWVYIPKDTSPGYYSVNLTLIGQNVSSNKLMLNVKVEGTPAYEAMIKGYRTSSEGYPLINLSEGDAFDIPVRVFNDGDFPIDMAVTAEIGDNWAYYISGAPWDKIEIEPGSASEFTVRSRVPNGTTGNYTAKIYLDGDGQTSMIMAQLDLVPRTEPMLRSDSLGGLLLAGGTIGAIAVSLVFTTRKRRRY